MYILIVSMFIVFLSRWKNYSFILYFYSTKEKYSFYLKKEWNWAMKENYGLSDKE